MREIDLDEHLAIEHPILQPHLLVGSSRIPPKWIIRQPVDTSALQIMNATEVRLGVNGDPPTPNSLDGLREALDRIRDAVLELQLRTRGATQQYDIRIHLPEADELRRIEFEFTAHLARDEVTVSDVRDFAEAISVGAAAREYASGLADYVYGILAKDRAGQTTLPFSAFLDKLKRSLGVLESFERPLAEAVVSCIRFNLNDFRSAWRPCGMSTLDRAFWNFRQRCLGTVLDHTQSSPPPPESDSHSCPVDTVTGSILEIIDASDPVPALRGMASRCDLSDEDRVKVYVLLADRVADLRPEDALACRELLGNDHMFGRWATHILGGRN